MLTKTSYRKFKAARLSVYDFLVNTRCSRVKTRYFLLEPKKNFHFKIGDIVRQRDLGRKLIKY